MLTAHLSAPGLSSKRLYPNSVLGLHPMRPCLKSGLGPDPMRSFLRSMLRTLPFWLLLLYFSPHAQSQSEFYLEKPPFKRTLIQPGDSIRVMITGMDRMIGLQYQGARDSTLFLSGDSLRLDQIERIWLRRSRNGRYWMGMIVSCGLSAALVFPPLMIIDAVSRGGFENYDIKRIGYSIGGGLSIAAITYRFRWKRYKLDGNHRLAIRIPVEKSVLPASPGGQGPDNQ